MPKRLTKEIYDIQARMDTGEVVKGFEQIENKSHHLRDTLIGVFSAEALIGGFNTLVNTVTGGFDKMIAKSKEYLEISGQHEIAQVRLQTALKVTGQSYAQNADRIRELMEAMKQSAGIGEREYLDVLGKLTVYTQDLDKAMQALPVVFDMAGTGMFSLDQATANVGLSMQGMLGQFSRLVPALKQFSEEELKAGKHLELLGKMFGGQAAAYTRTYIGSIETLKARFEDLVNILMGGTRTSVTDLINALADRLQKLSNDPAMAHIGQELGQISHNLITMLYALLGEQGKTGLVNAIDDLLTKFERYTGSQEFADDLQGLAQSFHTLTVGISSTIAQLDKYLAIIRMLKNIGDIAYDITPFGWWQQSGTTRQDYSEFYQAWQDYQKASAGKASGGMVPGTFDGDKIPYIGRGEYIINPIASKKWKPILDYINYVDSPYMGGGLGYATGGFFGGNDTMPWQFGAWKDFASYVPFETDKRQDIDKFIQQMIISYGKFPEVANLLNEIIGLAKQSPMALYSMAHQRLDIASSFAIPQDYQAQGMLRRAYAWAKSYISKQDAYQSWQDRKAQFQEAASQRMFYYGWMGEEESGSAQIPSKPGSWQLPGMTDQEWAAFREQWSKYFPSTGGATPAAGSGAGAPTGNKYYTPTFSFEGPPRPPSFWDQFFSAASGTTYSGYGGYYGRGFGGTGWGWNTPKFDAGGFVPGAYRGQYQWVLAQAGEQFAPLGYQRIGFAGIGAGAGMYGGVGYGGMSGLRIGFPGPAGFGGTWRNQQIVQQQGGYYYYPQGGAMPPGGIPQPGQHTSGMRLPWMRAGMGVDVPAVAKAIKTILQYTNVDLDGIEAEVNRLRFEG